MWDNNEGSCDYACRNRSLTRNGGEMWSSWGNFCSLLKKDFRMLISGKFFLVALGSLVNYTEFINIWNNKYINSEH